MRLISTLLLILSCFTGFGQSSQGYPPHCFGKICTHFEVIPEQSRYCKDYKEYKLKNLTSSQLTVRVFAKTTQGIWKFAGYSTLKPAENHTFNLKDGTDETILFYYPPDVKVKFPNERNMEIIAADMKRTGAEVR